MYAQGGLEFRMQSWGIPKNHDQKILSIGQWTDGFIFYEHLSWGENLLQYMTTIHDVAQQQQGWKLFRKYYARPMLIFCLLHNPS